MFLGSAGDCQGMEGVTFRGGVVLNGERGVTLGLRGSLLVEGRGDFQGGVVFCGGVVSGRGRFWR